MDTTRKLCCKKCGVQVEFTPLEMKALRNLDKSTSEWVSISTAIELEQVLTACKTKLQAYRANSNGEYVGGVEHRALVRLIENTYERICKPILETPKGEDK